MLDLKGLYVRPGRVFSVDGVSATGVGFVVPVPEPRHLPLTLLHFFGGPWHQQLLLVDGSLPSDVTADWDHGGPGRDGRYVFRGADPRHARTLVVDWLDSSIVEDLLPHPPPPNFA